MTDRLKGLSVAFERDIREDDAEAIIAAIKQLRGVLAVQPLVSSAEDWIAQERVRQELGDQLLDVVYPKRKGGE